MLYADFMTRLPEHSLMLTDRMTMAHGLEARSPYLDHHLVEYLAAFPSWLKIRNRTTKYIFRKLAENYLPANIVSREKQGFMFPIAYWFKNDAYKFISQTLLGSHYVRTGLFRKETIQKLLIEHRSNQRDHHVRLWMLLNLEIWHQIFIDGKDYDAVTQDFAYQLS
jgi:asparagine synthase (glutamine-hydrolysing)